MYVLAFERTDWLKKCQIQRTFGYLLQTRYFRFECNFGSFVTLPNLEDLFWLFFSLWNLESIYRWIN